MIQFIEDKQGSYLLLDPWKFAFDKKSNSEYSILKKKKRGFALKTSSTKPIYMIPSSEDKQGELDLLGPWKFALDKKSNSENSILIWRRKKRICFNMLNILIVMIVDVDLVFSIWVSLKIYQVNNISPLKYVSLEN